MDDLDIRKATFEEMDFFLQLAKDEGWNPGLNDAGAFYSTDPEGFFIALKGKEKIGCISAVAYNSTYGFMGFYVVIPRYRSQGVGHLLWAKAIDHLGERAIGLDGVLAQQKTYEQHRFRVHYNNYRFSGKPITKPSSRSLMPLESVNFDTLANYDSRVFGVKRDVFLRDWLRMPNIHSAAKMKDGQMEGYGVIRKCVTGYKIGPLFANNKEIAIEIFEQLCRYAVGETIFLDVPGINPDAMQVAQTYGLKPKFETVRMYNKKPPQQLLENVFGVTSFELG